MSATVHFSLIRLLRSRSTVSHSFLLLQTSKAFALSLLILCVQACNLSLLVPTGGAIHSSTGANDCAEGQTCTINVPGVPFSDTFTAIPKSGYTFVGWQEGEDYLCSGKTTPCVLMNIPAALTALDTDLNLAPVFEVTLTDLLPQTTRGVFQLFPNLPGAMNANVTSAPWGMGPLQILQHYSAALDIKGNAKQLILAQLADAPDAFLLVANLETADVDTLVAGINTTATGNHQGFSRWAIEGTDLQIAKLDEQSLAIAQQSTLELALDTYVGAADSISAGPLGGYLLGLNSAYPNTFIYGLPALYGPVSAPGTGDTSLSQAEVLSTSFSVENGTLEGLLGFWGANAQSYTAEMNVQLSGYPGPAIVSLPGLGIVDLDGLSITDDILPLAKTMVLDMDAIDYTDAVIQGGNAPWLNFKVGGDPAAIFINFEFNSPTEVAAFEAAHLPTGFSLVPFRMMEQDPLRTMMVLNIYQSSGGLVEGARAEWSVFVADPDGGEPRFMVIQAKAENLSADSVTPGFLTFGEPVTYTLQSGALESYVGEIDEMTMIETTYFSASIPWPQPPANYIPFARSFMPANDLVFWGNAVADKTLYNSTATNRKGAVVPAGQFTLTDNSLWSGFLKPSPFNAVVYLNPQEIVISPWFNLDANYLDVSPQLLTDLITFKNNFYPLTVQNIATAAIRGENVALSAANVADSVPTTHYHFPLTDPVGFLTAIAAPGVHTPVAVEIFDGESAGHYLTLSVFQRENDACGLRAEWVTYIAGQDGYPESLRLDAFSSQACIDPVSVMTVANDITQHVNGDAIETQINTPFIQFEATVDLLPSDSELSGINFLEAHERVCSLNNICDELYYDGQLVSVPAQRANTVATQIMTINTPWDSYISHAGARATVRLNTHIQTFNPWRNLRPFAAPAPAP